MSTNRLLTVSLKLLKRSGMDPRDKDIISKIQRFVFIVTNILLYIDFLLICIFDWKGFDSMAEIAIYITFAHVGYKLFALMAKKQRYVYLINLTTEFTQWERLQGEIKEDVDKTANIFLKVIQVFQIIVAMAGSAYCILPFFITSKRITPVETHFSKYYVNTGIYITAYILHTFDFYQVVITILGYDILYMTLITTINIELRIIAHRIKNIIIEEGDEVKMDEIAEIVDQHNKVLNVIKEFNSVFSDILAWQFLSSTILLSTTLFSIMDSFPPPIAVMYKFGLHLSASMSQLFIYCTLGQMLINQTESISEAAYNIKWWVKPQPRLRRACILMIQRANKLECLLAAGTFIVNYESFTKVLKFGFSLCSLAHAMKTRTEHV